jgi:phosphohistidine phosphatase
VELYILRHGLAESKSATGSDADRKLTAEGIEQVRRQMKRAAALGVSPEAVLSSPYVRAQQTAAIAAESLGYQDPIMASAALVPDARPGDIWAEIRAFSGQVLLVSHEPLVSATLAWMTGVSETTPFPTAGLARLDLENHAPIPRAQLRWLFR